MPGHYFKRSIDRSSTVFAVCARVFVLSINMYSWKDLDVLLLVCHKLIFSYSNYNTLTYLQQSSVLQVMSFSLHYRAVTLQRIAPTYADV